MASGGVAPCPSAPSEPLPAGWVGWGERLMAEQQAGAIHQGPMNPCDVGQRGATGGGDSLGSEGPAMLGDAVLRLGPVTAPREIKPGLGLGSNPPSQKEADGVRDLPRSRPTPGTPAASVYPPRQMPVPPHAQTPGSTETAASALLIADLQLTCSRGPQTARVQSRPELPGTAMGPEDRRSLRGTPGQPLRGPF